MAAKDLGSNTGFNTLKTELEKHQKEVQMNNQSSNMSWAKYAVLAVGGAIGGYLLWSNRSKIQSFLKAKGVEIPSLPANMGDAVNSRVAKIKSVVAREVKSLNGNGADHTVNDSAKPLT